MQTVNTRKIVNAFSQKKSGMHHIRYKYQKWYTEYTNTKTGMHTLTDNEAVEVFSSCILLEKELFNDGK